MSAAFTLPNPTILPYVWAIGARLPLFEAAAAPPVCKQPAADYSFYRRYTEAVLRRYVRMSMEAGKVPSLMGQEMFRGKVTSYRVGNFDDVVIFLHDLERCLEKLDVEDRELIARVAIQQYTAVETAKLLGVCPRTVLRRYPHALDRLTRIFLEAGMLERLEGCQ